MNALKLWRLTAIGSNIIYNLAKQRVSSEDIQRLPKFVRPRTGQQSNLNSTKMTLKLSKECFWFCMRMWYKEGAYSREKELMFVECLLNTRHYTRGWQTFSVKVQTVDILGSVAMWFCCNHISLCRMSKRSYIQMSVTVFQ